MLAQRIRSQLGRHMIGIHQWGATVLLLGSPRKVGVTQKGHCRSWQERARKRTWRLHLLSTTRETGRLTRGSVRHCTKVSKGYQRSLHKIGTIKDFWRHFWRSNSVTITWPIEYRSSMLIRSGVTVSDCHNFCLFTRQCLTNRSQIFYSVTSRNDTFTQNFDDRWSRF